MSDAAQSEGAQNEAPLQNLTEEEQASIAKAKEGLTETNPNALPPEGPQRPEYIPEKFWNSETGEANLEALAKSYAELEKARSQPKEEKPAEEGEGAPKAADENGKIQKAAEGEPEANPLTDLMTKAQTEWAEGQEVTEETVKALEEAGIPSQILQTYLRGVQEITKAEMAQVYSYVDGEENYSKMADWASRNLTQGELDKFNLAIDDAELRENAILGLYSRYQKANPSEGTLRGPQGESSNAGDVYRDRSELIKDQSDPRYATDASFRREVQEKLMRSQRSGFALHQRSMFERTITNS